MKKLRLTLLFALFASIISFGCAEKPRIRTPVVSLGSKDASIAKFHAGECDESLWSHIYNSGRLEVIDKCIGVTGTVDKVIKEDDGDYTIHILLDQGFEVLLGEQNIDKYNGALLVRAICQHKDKEKKEECKSLDKPLAIPAKGAHVRVVGSYVLDRTTAYAVAGIYPATSITTIP